MGLELLLISFLLYDGKWHIKVFATLFIIMLGAFIETVVALALGYLMQANMQVLLSNPVYEFEARAFSSLLYFLAVIIIVRFKRSDSSSLPALYSIILMIIPVSSGVIINQFFAVFAKDKLDYSIIFSVLGLLYINIIFYALFEALIRQSEVQMRYNLAQQQLDIQVGHYERLIENRKMILEMIHDVRNHLNTIEALASEGNTQLILEYMHTLKNDSSDILRTIDTGHPVIDAVLDEKRHAANEVGIEMDIKVMLPNDLGINNVDLCIILGNALDNAIEACQKISGNSIKKAISVKLSVSNNYFVAVISNTFSEAYDPIINNLVTSKKNKQLHGFGLQNIENTVEKYSGNVQILRKGSDFILNIVMKMHLVAVNR